MANGVWGIMNFNSLRGFSTALLASTILVVVADPVQAQTLAQPAPAASSQARTVSFNIPAGPLTGALIAYSSVAGVDLVYDGSLAARASSPGVSGSLTPEEGLRRLLAGTGLTYRFTAANSATLVEAPRTGGDAAVLPVLTVQGQRGDAENAWGPVSGYTATRSASATKTDTPIIETPQSISIVTRELMEAQAPSNLGAALRYAPGVSAEAFGLDTREGGLRIRGFDASSSGFFRDGLTVKSSNFANFPLDPYAAERIEVLRGPSSVMYGQSNPGGLVNFVSKMPTAQPLHEVQLGLGSFDRHEGRFDISEKVDEQGKLAYRLTGLARESGTQVDYVDHDRVFIAPALTWQPNDNTSLTILANYQKDNAGWGIQFLPAAGTVLPNPNGRIPSSRFTGEPGLDYYDLTQYAVGYMFEHSLNDVWTLRQNARYSYLQNSQLGVFGGGFQADLRTLDRYGSFGDSELDGFALDNQAQAKFATGAITHTLLLGIDYQRTVFKDRSIDYAAGSIDVFNPTYGQALGAVTGGSDSINTQKQIGVYAQDQLKLDDRWVLVLGGRRDSVEAELEDRFNGSSAQKDSHDFTGRAGLLYLADNGLAPYVSYSESFNPVADINPATGQPLEPETGRQYELGLKYQTKGRESFVGAAVFDIRRQNYVTYDPVDFDPHQTGEIHARGLELEAVAKLTPEIRLVGSYSWLKDFEITKSSYPDEVGKRDEAVPEHMASLWLDYRFQQGALTGLGFGAGLRYTGRSYGDDINSFTVPAFTLVDGAVYYDWQAFRFALNASNLFDKEHIAACQTSFSHCYYGEGRKILGTATYRW